MVRFSKASFGSQLTTPTQRLNHMRFHKEWAIVSAMRGLVVLLGHDSRKYILRTSALFQSLRSVVNRLSNSSRFPPQQYKTIRMQQVMITTVIRPVIAQQLILCSSIHVSFSYSAPESHSDFGRCCLSYQCRRCQGSRCTWDVLSVHRYSFKTGLGRPLMCFLLSKSQSITKRFQIRAWLTVPRIFSLLSSWFFSFCCSQKYCVSMCLMAPLPLQRASPRAAAASCPDSYVTLVSQFSYRVGQPDGHTRTAYHAVVLRFRAAQ